MDKIYVNKNIKEKVNYVLERIGTDGLVAIGIGFIAIATLVPLNISKINEYNNKAKVQTFGQTLESDFTSQYVTWLNEEKGEEVEISEQIADVLDKTVPNFYASKNNYEDLASVVDDNNSDLVNSRVALISSVNNLKSSSMDILNLKLKSDMSLSDNAIITITKDDNSADGRTYQIVIEDNGVKYVMLSNAVLGDKSIPDKYLKVIESYNKIDKYQGDGSNSEAWDKKTMQKYVDSAETLLYETLGMSLEKENIKQNNL